jgi:hypothetical protein
MIKIGIKRKFFPGYQVYKCDSFYFRSFIESLASDDTTIEVPITPWLVLVMADGSKIAITDVEKRGYKIFAPKGGVNAI